MKRLITLLAALNCRTGLFAQDQGNAEMADLMRSNGKIYVVVAVLLVIFCGIIIYLVRIDRKVAKLENEVKAKNKPS